jgi:hypothetical protein
MPHPYDTYPEVLGLFTAADHAAGLDPRCGTTRRLLARRHAAEQRIRLGSFDGAIAEFNAASEDLEVLAGRAPTHRRAPLRLHLGPDGVRLRPR